MIKQIGRLQHGLDRVAHGFFKGEAERAGGLE